MYRVTRSHHHQHHHHHHHHHPIAKASNETGVAKNSEKTLIFDKNRYISKTTEDRHIFTMEDYRKSHVGF